MIDTSQTTCDETTMKGHIVIDIDEILRNAREQHAAFERAVATIDRMTIDPNRSNDAYRPDTVFDTADTAFRDMLCEGYDYDDDPKWGYARNGFTREMHNELLSAFRMIDGMMNDAEYAREWMSRKCLDDSVCPMHRCDYQACFDDDDPECAAIRIVFPSHDT